MPKYKTLYIQDLSGEKWLPIKGYPNYEVSNMGRIKSLSRTVKMPHSPTLVKPDTILTPGCTRHGYLYVNLKHNGVIKSKTINRLVGIAFIPNPKKFKIVDHVKGNKKDNRASELEWTTSAINNKRAYDLGLKKGVWTGIRGTDNPSSKPISQFTLDGQYIRDFAGQQEAARELGFSQGNIGSAIHGRQKHCGGFIWRFAQQ